MKVCHSCGEAKEPTEYFSHSRTRDGLRSSCKGCENKKRNDRRQRFPHLRRASTLKQEYGLTQQDFDGLIEAQGGKCAICQDDLVKPFIDHNHQTGEIRGILCLRCNSGIGFLRDDPDLLHAAIRYLEGQSESAMDE